MNIIMQRKFFVSVIVIIMLVCSSIFPADVRSFADEPDIFEVIPEEEQQEADDQAEDILTEKTKTENSYCSGVLFDSEKCRIELKNAEISENGFASSVRCVNKTENTLGFYWEFYTQLHDEENVTFWKESIMVNAGAEKEMRLFTSEIVPDGIVHFFADCGIKGGIVAECSADIKSDGNETMILDAEISPLAVDFDALKDRNEDVEGWLYCADTFINYPVVQAEDNSTYIHSNIDGDYSAYGTLFSDALGEYNFNNDNTVIYGHHMNDGKMFGRLVNYAKQNYYDEHPVMYLNTPDMNYRVELFSAFLTDMESEAYTLNFDSDEQMEEWVEYAKEHSAFAPDHEIEIFPGDRIITLSTCTYEYDTARYVVMGKLIPIH